MLRVTAHLPAAQAKGVPIDTLVLPHDARRLRRKLIVLPKGIEILIDFADPVTLNHGDRLQLEDGRLVGVAAAEEPVYEIRARDAAQLARLAWHIGNRHLPAQIEKSRILIARDRIIRDMLTGLGANIRETIEHFSPEQGAYSHAHAAQPNVLSAR